MQPERKIEIVHRLPGRLRLRLSRELKDPERALSSVREHEGLTSISYTPVTGSVLTHFNPAHLHEEEIVLRVALAFGLDAGTVPVHVGAVQKGGHMTASGWVAAGLLLAAAAMRAVGRSPLQNAAWERAAAGVTAGSVVQHSWHDFVEHEQHFGLEVLSLGYLATAFLRGNLLQATAVTWMATFGRHLVDGSGHGIVVRPVQRQGEDGVPRYEVVVSPEPEGAGSRRFLTALRGLGHYVMAGLGGRDLLGEVRRLSRVHGEVLEGMGWMPDGIPLKFRSS